MTEGNARDLAHWQDDDLLVRLYGLEPERREALHALESCPECSARFDAFSQRRRQGLSASPVSDDFLRAQRQAIYAKIEDRKRSPLHSWKVPVGATAVVVFLGVLLQQPAPKPIEEPVAAVSDAQFFSEIATLASDDEPRAAQPIKALFSESQ
jgi:hypothetical protein